MWMKMYLGVSAVIGACSTNYTYKNLRERHAHSYPLTPDRYFVRDSISSVAVGTIVGVFWPLIAAATASDYINSYGKNTFSRD